MPLTVRLLVPLWVVNATALPIAVTATKLTAQREKRPSRQDSALDATAVRMKELSTDAQPNFRCLAPSQVHSWHCLRSGSHGPDCTSMMFKPCSTGAG